MNVIFDRDPFGWVHPFYRCRRHPMLSDWDNFVGPALETVNSLNHMLQLAQHEPRDGQVYGLQRREQQGADKFEVTMNVQQFSPEELEVKMVDNCLVVEGKHEEKKDEQGFISRHFVRRYQLPDDVKPETVTCSLGSDGVLSVSAPRMIDQKPGNERHIPINFVGQPKAASIEKKNEPAKQEELKDEGTEKR